MAKKARKAKAAGKKKAGKKSAVKKKAVAKKAAVKKAKKVVKAKKVKKVAKKAFAPNLELDLAPKLAVPAPLSITPIVSKCANDYIIGTGQHWNPDGTGNSKNLSDLHLDIPLFLDGVRRCLEGKTDYTFDVTVVAGKVQGGTVSSAKQEIVLASTHK